jgi:asparagine synthase (glutamine-hydrolysing)
MAERFFGRDLDHALRPGFGHGPRWQSTAAVKRLFARDLRAALVNEDPVAALLAEAPDDLPRWSALAQDQWIEITTLLSSYLLSAQGDRMAMAHSVEGRFPFLDTEVVDLAARLPDAHKLRVLDEKHVLKRAARGLIPEAIIARKKQPYRAPDALAFAGGRGREFAQDVLSPAAVERAGVFDPAAVQRLLAKCIAGASAGQLSNVDNMALVGALSTQLLYDQVVRAPAPHASQSTTGIEEAR